MSKYKRSPFAPKSFPPLPAIKGFEMGTAEAGVKYQGRTDLWVMVCSPDTQIAGVFTKNLCPGAPVEWSRSALGQISDGPRLIIVNSGTANVFTGAKGRQAVEQTAKGATSVFGGEPEGVFLSSTGVIGEPLDASKLVAQFPQIKAELTPDGWAGAAKAIMTTDTYPKGATASCEIDGAAVTINGIAKGSGMIAPDMATMLGYIATDANLSQSALQALLSDFTHGSFNAITVDSDTSTSDTVLLAASGAAGHERIDTADDPRLAGFRAALEGLMKDLALQIVKDGEGISKFITIEVEGAVSDVSAKKIGLSIANSPLVKTAIAGEDANWGRIVMAVGKAGEPAERDTLSIWMGPHRLAENGAACAGYREEDGAAYMKNANITIRIDLGLGSGKSTVYTCDLTHAYIDINADYRS